MVVTCTIMKVNLTFLAPGYRILIYLCLIPSAYHVSMKYCISLLGWQKYVEAEVAFREKNLLFQQFLICAMQG